MTIMNTNRDIYHWKDGKKPILKIILQKVKNPPWGKIFEKPQFYEKRFFDAKFRFRAKN